jgi:DNA (cytosine-5)-methyltransferase 1
MWASPDCTQFSKAKGSKPRESGIRMLPWAVYKHAKAVHPEVLIMENVEEIQDWGALDENGYPIEAEKGKEYERFIAAMTSLGYEFDSRELIAADYGAPTTRKRWYAIFRNDGRKIEWPVPTHFKDRKPRWKQCGDYIDWSDLGSSIFDRKKPLAEKTQARIAYGIKKYILDNPNPYVVKDNRALAFMIQYHSEQKSGDSRGQLLTEPIKTLDTSNRYGLVTAFITKFYKTGIGQGCNEPLHTITTSPGHFGVVSTFLVKYYNDPETNNQGLERPIDTLVTKDRFGLVGVLVDIEGEKYIMSDIFLRMLKPEELKVLQGFPKDYIIGRDYLWRPYPKKEQVARIGNSVVPVMAKVLVEANCPYLKVGNRQPIPTTYWNDSGQMAFA